MTSLEDRAAALVGGLSLDEQIGLLAGRTNWRNHDAPGIPALRCTDGPNGARGEAFGVTKAVVVPVGSGLGATWDVHLMRRVGELLGEETRRRGCHVLLGPTINLHRTPVGGRNFECMSEDPELTARLAVAVIGGIQSRGVAACAKHFVGNDTEFERHSIDVRMSVRALRELYLRPFEAAVVEGHVWSVMAAYNRLFGEHCTENRDLLTGILRDDWGFDGVVVSDWFATRSSVPSLMAGLDWEMPGPRTWYRRELADAVLAGDVDEGLVLERATAIARLALRTGAVDEPPRTEHDTEPDPAEAALCREAAVGGLVLLRNGGSLPLPARVGSLAVVGPLADRAQIMGGGSSEATPLYRRTPLDALRDRFAPLGTEVRHEAGAVVDRTARVLDGHRLLAVDGADPITVRYTVGPAFGGEDGTAPVIAAEHRPDSRVVWFGNLPDGVDPRHWAAELTCTFVAAETGPHTVGVTCTGAARLSVDGALVVDAWSAPTARGEAFFGLGSVELTGVVAMEAGRAYEVRVEYAPAPRTLPAVQFGIQPPVHADAVERAVAAATGADAVVVMVGTTAEWETEGHDRTSMRLPGAQDELVAAVAAANPRTVVVVVAGGPVDMPWCDEVDAVLWSYFGGLEMAEAIADVLTGAADPGGRLPTTFPLRLADHPAAFSYPGDAGTLYYGEDVFVGYRGYDRRDAPVRFPFGHGLSFAPVSWEEGRLESGSAAGAGRLTAVVRLHNPHDRPATEVVQAYVAGPEVSAWQRPPRQLAGFTKVHLAPGEARDVPVDLVPRAFEVWDAHTGDWTVERGTYTVHLGRSSRDLRLGFPVALP